ncbi:MAG TPA: pantothenate kinase [Leptolyngbyaceae cyanobacterium]
MFTHADGSSWLALVIGNTRLHWAFFKEQLLQRVWHTPHLTLQEMHFWQQGIEPKHWPEDLVKLASAQAQSNTAMPWWVASVVQPQLQLWESYPFVQVVQRHHIPLGNLYPTLGVDRALALLGAGTTYSWPSLVIDGGTALTFTAGVEGQFWGGAILPGLSLQFQALANQTDALPHIEMPSSLPARWATNTEEAIQSGILYTQIAGICDYINHWQKAFPTGQVLLTGGDGERLRHFIGELASDLAGQIRLDANLMFWGLRAYREAMLTGC